MAGARNRLWTAVLMVGVLQCNDSTKAVQCTRTVDCPGERLCFEGKCLVACADHEDCPTTDACALGVCRPGVRADAAGDSGARGDPSAGDPNRTDGAHSGDTDASGDAAVFAGDDAVSGDSAPGGDFASPGDAARGNAGVGDSCVLTNDCQIGLKCENNVCCAADGPACCASRFDCPARCTACDYTVHSCQPKDSGTDCDICGACDGAGTCVYDETQDNDCFEGETVCGQCAGLGQCAFNVGVDCGASRSCDDAGRCIVPECITVETNVVLNCDASAAEAYCGACDAGGTPSYTCSSAPDERYRCSDFISCASCRVMSCCDGACITDITCP